MPSWHDYGIDCETFFGGTPDDEIDEGDLRFDLPPAEQGPFLCVCCHVNGVDALNGFDTCEECLAKQ